MNYALVAAVVLAILQLLDLYSTHLFRSVGVPEANPIFGPTFNRLPFWAAAVLKLAVSGVLIVAALHAPDLPTQLLLAIPTAVMCIVYADTVLSNFRAYRRHREKRR